MKSVLIYALLYIENMHKQIFTLLKITEYNV